MAAHTKPVLLLWGRATPLLHTRGVRLLEGFQVPLGSTVKAKKSAWRVCSHGGLL